VATSAESILLIYFGIKSVRCVLTFEMFWELTLSAFCSSTSLLFSFISFS
jgi:hypothetical protein